MIDLTNKFLLLAIGVFGCVYKQANMSPHIQFELTWHPVNSPFSFFLFILYIFQIYSVFINKVLQGFIKTDSFMILKYDSEIVQKLEPMVETSVGQVSPIGWKPAPAFTENHHENRIR